MIKYSKIIFILMSDYKLTLFVNEKTLIPDLYKVFLNICRYVAKKQIYCKKQMCWQKNKYAAVKQIE